ncbi:HNH endonuclease [Desertihabitans brevis]|uniref:HNH endonuclease n=1 Tax=Desertihabitans brevis TaxID=2268447 RepID=A0A367YU56_9ACTN|nr:HNH endonuclease [Desertihabitans brevis]
MVRTARRRVTVKPVIDLAAEDATEAHPFTTAMREKIALRDRTCVFPYCTWPAHPYRRGVGSEETGWSVDHDHVVAFAAGGATSTANGAPLCRVHHNLKTHAGWRYRVVGTRSYLWSSPHGYRYRRDRDGGTTDLGHPRPPAPSPGDWPSRAEPLSTSIPAALGPSRRLRGRLPWERDRAPAPPVGDAAGAVGSAPPF